MSLNSPVLDTVLLLALPASGKSEVRKYLASMTAEQCRNDFCMGETVQLDDFPYVHVMRCIDDALQARGLERVFFHSSDRPFKDPHDWGTLIQLINEDYDDLLNSRTHHPKSSALHLFNRIDAASKRVGLPARIAGIEPKAREAIADALEKECAPLLADKNELSQVNLAGKTIVIEFARGGKQGSSMPLPAPFGYQYSLSQLSDTILKRARILYVWVTPEESRRKNHERTNPDDPGSILHHGVPIEVMLNDYGCDDMEWLEKQSSKKGTVEVKMQGQTFRLPLARFDNRVDKTSFIRNDRTQWKSAEVQAVHDGLKGALQTLSAYQA